MKPARLESLTVVSVFLEVPVADFESLPRDLGCTLHRAPRRLSLESDAKGCGLVFEVLGPFALLTEVEVKGEGAVRFLREVVGPLFERYKGDLEAALEFSNIDDLPTRLVIKSGSCGHPLVAQGEQADVPIDLDLVAQLLQQATAQWAEYLRLKAQRSGSDPAREA